MAAASLVCVRPRITSASNPDLGARRAVHRLGEARLAPTIDVFTCPRNNVRESPSLSKPATVAHLLRKIYIDTHCISKK